MSREKELYPDTLERIRRRADELYPNKLVYTQKEASAILGVSTRTLSRRGLKNYITAEQLARCFS